MGAYSAARGPLAGLWGDERDRLRWGGMERGGERSEGRERNRKEGANEKAWKEI